MKDFNSKDIIHIKDGEVEYLKFKILENYKDKITHCITLRHGGVSQGLYKSLNFRTLGNDKYSNVYKNLEIICSKIGIQKENVYKARQAHTENILILDNEKKTRYKFSNRCEDNIDGYITNKSNINSLVTTADCNPIIIYDPVNNVISNIHSGWKGTLKKISLKAAIIMHEKFGSKYEDLIVCIGPSIRKCCFTSKEKEFKEKFTKVFPNEKKYITKEDNNRYHIDLIQIIRNDFLDFGLKKDNIVVCDICTCCNEKDFFSYRKATQRKDEDYATFSTIVGIK